MYTISYSCQILIILEFSRLIFENPSNVKFHLDATCSMRAGGRTGMIKLIVALHNFVNAPETETTPSLNSLCLYHKKTECHTFCATHQQKRISAYSNLPSFNPLTPN